MQFFWLYMDELIGKGLGVWMIIQLLFYMSTTLVPLALPLGILLASIMTFGNMGENMELVAIKSAGISLLRFMRPLVVFIVITGAFAFFINNNVIPFANLKALSLLYDLRNSKPAFNIRAGQFNKGIEGFSIRVGKKDNDGRTIHDVLIYDHTSGSGNDKIVLARTGQMIPSPDKQFMIFRLKDGWRYEETNEGNVHKQMRMYFKSWDKIFDLSSFRLTRTNEKLFKDSYQMMNVKQLNELIDSLQHTDTRIASNVSTYIGPYVTLMAQKEDSMKLVGKLDAVKVIPAYRDGFFGIVNDTLRKLVIEIATGNVRNAQGLLAVSSTEKELLLSNFMKFNIEWHRKFTLSFACLLLFLIGAPLGAIIRKGGIGMPLVIAVLFFVVFHIMSVTGEKLAKTESLYPWAGMWMSTAMLLPIAFFLINQARNDSQVLSKEWYLRILGKLKLFKNR
jgi:lipopolysaccharide export system permease protein